MAATDVRGFPALFVAAGPAPIVWLPAAERITQSQSAPPPNKKHARVGDLYLNSGKRVGTGWGLDRTADYGSIRFSQAR